MSLHGVLRINGNAVVGYSVRRVYPPYAMDDTVCTYEWAVQRDYQGHLITEKGQVRHRYGDGVEILLSKVLALAGPALVAQQQVLEQAEEHDPIKREMND